MGITLSSKEILEIAMGIEENGEKFYLIAADKVNDPELKKLLTDLANWEKGHRIYFANLLDKIEQDDGMVFNYPDLQEEVSLYLKAIADSNVFKAGLPVEDVLGDLTGSRDIIDQALEREKDAVAYFSAVKYSFSSPQDQADIDKIIVEELSHIRYLMEKRRKFN